MAGAFFDDLNAVLPDQEAMFGEDWIFNNAAWPAIAIDKEDTSNRAMQGGEFRDARVVVFVREEIFTSSGVKAGSIITIRGADVQVLTVEQDGDAARALICGPSQVNVWR